MVGCCDKNCSLMVLSKLKILQKDICSEGRSEGYLVEADVQYLENLHDSHDDILFFPGINTVDKVKNLQQICDIKKHILYI